MHLWWPIPVTLHSLWVGGFKTAEFAHNVHTSQLHTIRKDTHTYARTYARTHAHNVHDKALVEHARCSVRTVLPAANIFRRT